MRTLPGMLALIIATAVAPAASPTASAITGRTRFPPDSSG